MKKTVTTLIFFLLLFTEVIVLADTWTQRASITGAKDGAVGFSIGNKGYIGTGFNSGAMTYYHDFWEFDPDSNTWTQKADFAGGNRTGAFGFSIGQKGYIGTGLSQSGFQNDFWEWDEPSNAWIQRANYAGIARGSAVAFSIGVKGYVGTGTVNGSTLMTNEFWEWDGDTASATFDTWIQKANFGGTARGAACGFSIGSKGYIGTGTVNGFSDGAVRDFWEWDGDTLSATYNAWTRKADFIGTSRSTAGAFALGQFGYVGVGVDTFGLRKNDFW